MNGPEIYEQLAFKILRKLRENLTDKYRIYFYGDPVLIGESQMPCLIVDWEHADPRRAPTMHDEFQNQIVVKLLHNKKDDLGKIDVKGNNQIVAVPSRLALERDMMGRAADTGQYLDDTVMGVLRNNLTMDGKSVDQMVRIDFGNSVRQQRPGVNETMEITSESWATIQTKEMIEVPNRK